MGIGKGGFVKKGKRDQDSDSSDDEGNAYFGEALVVVGNDEMTKLLGDNRTCTIKGKGKVKIQLRDGSSFILEDVSYVPGLRRSLISLGTLEKEGYTVKMQMGRIKVTKGCRVMMIGIRKKKCVYTLEAKVMTFGVPKNGGGRGRGVKEKDKHGTATGSVIESNGIVNDATPLVDSVANEVVSPYVVDETVAKEKQSSLVNTTGLGSYPPLPTHETTSTGNAPVKSSYANVTGKPSGKKLNIRTLFTPGGNGVDVVVPIESVRAICDRFANTTYGFFLGKRVEYPVIANYVRNTWDGLDAMLDNGPWFIQNNPLILKKWHLDENLLKEDVSTIPVWVKLHGVPITAFIDDGLSAIATKLGTPLMLDSYTSDMCMQSWGRSSYARVMIELRAEWICLELRGRAIILECQKNTSVGEKKTVKKPSQTSRGVPVGPKMGFKPRKEYRPVPKKPNANSSGNKKKGVEPTIEFASNTPIGEKINKIERQIYEGKLRLLDNDGNPLVPMGIVESDSELEVVFDETANLRISTSGKYRSDKGYGTNSLLEQWRDSYPDNDDYDSYNDDMYENHDLSEHLQSICDDRDITVEKYVWFEVELHGAQGNREAEIFQVSNDDATVAQGRVKDKQLEEKANTDCLVKE
ncbi:beta-caryophyllene synthase [Tanacetum coccineum]